MNNRDILKKPFGPEQIKQREGNFGKKLDYIEGHAVIQRLNEAFDADWSFIMTKYEIMQETDEVIVIGELKAGGVVKTQFGSSRITRARETGDIISLADDLKSAATDALKKAATLLGVGLHLYRNELPNGGHRNGYGRTNGGNRNGGNGNGNSRPHRSNGNGGNGSATYCGSGNGGNGNGRLTSKQYKYCLKLNSEKAVRLPNWISSVWRDTALLPSICPKPMLQRSSNNCWLDSSPLATFSIQNSVFPYVRKRHAQVFPNVWKPLPRLP